MDACANGLAAALNAHTYGNGSPTIVLSHGYGTNQTIWHYIVPVLAMYFKVLVYDLAFSPNVNPPLYDPSRYSNFTAYAHDLTCILDELKIKDTIFVGHSMSAMIGCIAAAQKPHLFRHLVLLNGSPRLFWMICNLHLLSKITYTYHPRSNQLPPNKLPVDLFDIFCRYLNDVNGGYMGGFSQDQVDSIFDSIQKNYTGWIEGFVPVAIGVDNATAIAEFEDSLLKLNYQVALSTARVVFLSDNRGFLPDVGVHTTIIQSQNDAIVPNSVAEYMEEKLGDKAKAKLRILNTTGHFLQLTEPDLLVSLLKDVIDGDKD